MHHYHRRHLGRFVFTDLRIFSKLCHTYYYVAIHWKEKFHANVEVDDELLLSTWPPYFLPRMFRQLGIHRVLNGVQEFTSTPGNAYHDLPTDPNSQQTDISAEDAEPTQPATPQFVVQNFLAALQSGADDEISNLLTTRKKLKSTIWSSSPGSPDATFEVGGVEMVSGAPT